MKTFGIISSLIMWGVAIWALVQPEKTTVHLLIIGGASLALFVHFIEASFFFWHNGVKQHLSAKNVILTLLFGVFHFMPFYKARNSHS